MRAVPATLLLLYAALFPAGVFAQPAGSEAQLRKEFAEAVKRKQDLARALLPLEKRKHAADHELIDKGTDASDAADTYANLPATATPAEVSAARKRKDDTEKEYKKAEAEQRDRRKKVKELNEQWQKADQQCDRLRAPLDRLDQARKEAREEAEKRLKAEADDLRKRLGTAEAERRAAQLEAAAQRNRADAEAAARALAERANASVAADPYKYVVNIVAGSSQRSYQNDPARADTFERALRAHAEITNVTRSASTANGVETVVLRYTVSRNFAFGSYWTRAEADERIRRLAGNGFTVNLTTIPK